MFMMFWVVSVCGLLLVSLFWCTWVVTGFEFCILGLIPLVLLTLLLDLRGFGCWFGFTVCLGFRIVIPY